MEKAPQEEAGLTINKIYIFYALMILTQPLGFLIRILYAHSISVEELGMFFSVIGFYGFLLFFTNLGLSSALRYFIPKFSVRGEYGKIRNIFYYTYAIQLVMTLIIATGVFLWREQIAEGYFHSQQVTGLLVVLLIYFISLNLLTSLGDVFVAFKLNTHYQTLFMLQMIVIFGASVLIWWEGVSPLYIYYGYAWAAGALICFIGYASMLFRKYPFLRSFPKFDRQLFVEHASYAFYNFFGGIGSLILSRTDIIVITYFLSLSDVALYSTSFTLISAGISMFGALAVLFMPMVAELEEKKDFEKLKSIFGTIYGIALYLIVPIVLVLSLFPAQILTLLYGKEYAAGYIVLAPFAFFVIFRIFMDYQAAFLGGLGMVKEIMRMMLPAAIANLIMDIVLAKLIGLPGVVMATILAWLYIFTRGFYLIKKKIGFSVKGSKLGKIGLAAMAYIATILLLKLFMPPTDRLVAAVVITLAGLAVYGLLGYLTRIYTPQEIYLLLPKGSREFVKKGYQTLFGKG